MKEYRRKRNGEDLIQVLGTEGSGIDFVLNPGAEQARQNNEQAMEQQLAMQQSSLPEDRDDLSLDKVPTMQEGEKMDHPTFLLWLFALIALVLLIAGVIVYHGLK